MARAETHWQGERQIPYSAHEKLLVIIGIVLVIAASAIERSGRLTSFLDAVIWKTGGLGGLA